MKKTFIISFIFLIFISLSNAAFAIGDITGRWAEAISERVVMDIYTDKNNTDEYNVFITWREDNLAQKDIYRFSAKLASNGELKYKNGLHIYRFFEKNKTEDKIDYKDGTGTIKLDNNKLIWIDNKDGSETEFIRANKDLTKDTTIKNKLFTITLPEELRGFYEAKREKDKISLFILFFNIWSYFSNLFYLLKEII